MNRRQFMAAASTAAAACFIEAHSSFTSSTISSMVNSGAGLNLISSVRLITHSPLDELKRFYRETLGLPVVSDKTLEFTILAGTNTITFVHSTEGQRPFYHFAFNIPENKIDLAFHWQSQRTEIIHPNPAAPKGKITHFPHWNAHSVFFLDPAGNLLEYIARHDLDNETSGNFAPKDILSVSEIGLIVDDIPMDGNLLQHEIGYDFYKPAESGSRFALGGNHGLLILIPAGKIWSSNEGQENKTSYFETTVNLNTSRKIEWNWPGYPYHFRSK